MEERVIVTSLNIVAWLKSHNVEVEDVFDGTFYYAVVRETDEVAELIKRYRENKELQALLHEFKVIKRYVAKKRKEM